MCHLFCFFKIKIKIGGNYYFIYRVVFVPALHVITDKLDVSDGLLQFERVALAATQLAHVAQVGRYGGRRRRRRGRRRRRRKIVKIDYLAEQLRSVVDSSRPSPSVLGIQPPVGDVLPRVESKSVLTLVIFHATSIAKSINSG